MQDAAPRALIVVDVQQGFINDFTRHVPERVARLVRRGGFDPVLFTRFVNTPESPYHTLLDWHECEHEPDTSLVPELVEFLRPGCDFPKFGVAGMPETLANCLRERKIESAALVGIDTDMCVLKVAMDAFDMGIKPTILVDCCASTGGLQAHLAGLAILSRNIGPFQLQLSGLHDGYLAGLPPSA